MKNLTGKTLEHVDGRKGYCVSARPYLGKVEVIVAGKREQWGPDEVDPVSFVRALGLLSQVTR